MIFPNIAPAKKATMVRRIEYTIISISDTKLVIKIEINKYIYAKYALFAVERLDSCITESLYE